MRHVCHCGGRFIGGTCNRCGTNARQRKAYERIDRRQNAAARGYDRQWQQVSKWVRQIWPLCSHCKRGGLVRPAVLVDHIRPLEGKRDERRFDILNLQPLCQACHNRKTNSQTAGEYDISEDLAQRAQEVHDWETENGRTVTDS